MEPTNRTPGAPSNVTSGAGTSGTSGAPSDAAAKKGILHKIDKKKAMEAAFALLKSQGKNTVDGIFSYLKERNILDDSTEKLAKQAMEGVSDPKNIDYAKFAEVCGSVAQEKGFDLENLTKSIARSLFGGGSASGSASSSSSVVEVGVPKTNDQHANVEHNDETADHHEPSEPHLEVAEDHHEPSEPHLEVAEDHNEPSEPHLEVAEDHHEPSEPHLEVAEDHHEVSEEHHESDEDHHK